MERKQQADKDETLCIETKRTPGDVNLSTTYGPILKSIFRRNKLQAGPNRIISL